MDILILGGSGAIGTRMVESLRSEGNNVIFTSRSDKAQHTLDTQFGRRRFVADLRKIVMEEEPSIIVSALADGVTKDRRKRLELANSEIDSWVLNAVEEFSQNIIFLKSELEIANEKDRLYAEWDQFLPLRERVYVLTLPKVSISHYRAGVFESSLVDDLSSGRSPHVVDNKRRVWTSTAEVIRTVRSLMILTSQGCMDEQSSQPFQCRGISLENRTVSHIFKHLFETGGELDSDLFEIVESQDRSISTHFGHVDRIILGEIANDFKLFIESFLRGSE